MVIRALTAAGREPVARVNGRRRPMIFITAKFQVLPEHADAWPEICAAFTAATRAEPGCLWFDWSRSLADPAEYVLVEAFRDGDAGAAHVRSEHFKTAQRTLPPFLARTPKIVNAAVPQDDWSLLGEMAVPGGR
jgi:quinol monooxygenase YgiN